MRAHTAEEYADQHDQLMPVGLAWNRHIDAPLAKLLQALAIEHARLEGRAINLVLKEFFPQTTRELLTEWETEWGLPDECTPAGATIAERIEILLRKIRSLGGQSIQYFIDLMATMGIKITITEFKPFRIGFGRAGDRIYGSEWIHTFLVTGLAARVYFFRAGLNCAGDRLRYWRRNEILECIINKLKPAHTYGMFGFESDSAYFTFDETGNVVLREKASPKAIDPLFDFDEEGYVVPRTSVPADAENTNFGLDSDGYITPKELQ